MATQCELKRIGENRYFLENACLPSPYNEKFEVTQYLRNDTPGAYADTTTAGRKVGSNFDEAMVSSFSLVYTFDCALVVGTFFSEYIQMIDQVKKIGNLNTMNNFILTIDDGVTVETFPLCYMALLVTPIQNVVATEYAVQFTIQANGKPIITNSTGFVRLAESPADVDITLTAEYNADDVNLDLTWTQTSTQFNWSALYFEVYNSTNILVETIMSSGMSPLTTTSGLFPSAEAFTVKAYAPEIGYGVIYQVGSASLIPTP